MEFITEIFNVLREDFGLGLSVILLAVIWKLLRYISEQHEERIEEQKSSITLLEGVKNWLESNERAFGRFADKTEMMTLKLERLSNKVEELSGKIE